MHDGKKPAKHYEKAKLGWKENSKLFYKRDAGIPPHSNLTKYLNSQKVPKPNIKTYSRNTKNLNQINILKKISIKIKPFFYMTKKSRQKLKYLKNEKRFYGEIKSIFHHFKRAFSCQKLSQTWEWAFHFHKFPIDRYF